MSEVKNIIERLRVEAEHSTIDVNTILDEIDRAVISDTSKAYSDGNIQGYDQGFKDGKRKGSVMHADGSVTWGDYTEDEALELAVEEALKDYENYSASDLKTKKECYNLGVFGLKAWYEEIKGND